MSSYGNHFSQYEKLPRENFLAGYDLFEHTDFMDGKQVGGCMCGDKIYLQRRIQTATEKHLESMN